MPVSSGPSVSHQRLSGRNKNRQTHTWLYGVAGFRGVMIPTSAYCKLPARRPGARSGDELGGGTPGSFTMEQNAVAPRAPSGKAQESH